MTAKAKWILRAGKALKLISGQWSDGEWKVVTVPETEVGNENVQVAGADLTKDEAYVIFGGRDGAFYAQPLRVAVDPSTLPIGRS